MKLFLVRHGKTLDEELGNRQSPDSVLGKEGEIQASLIAKRLQKENFDLIIASPFQRTKQTAEAISFENKTKIEYLDLLHEKEQDDKLYGAEKDSEINQKYLKELTKNYHKYDWSYLNGESIKDVLQRAKKVRDLLLKDYQDGRLVIVSHGIFLRCFILSCIFDKNFDKKIFMNLFHSITINCASLSEMEYNKDNKAWQLVSLNNREHLL